MCREEYAKKIDSAVFPGQQGGPLMHIIAAKAVAFKEALTPEFREYQGNIVKNAAALAAGLTKRGIALVSGGTDNHLILMDFTGTGITGKAAQEALGIAGITVNKNNIPFDTASPSVTSGLRVGTAALTTRGMRGAEMRKIASMFKKALDGISDESALQKVRAESKELAESFPIFGW